MILDPFKFLPNGTINTLRSVTAWDLNETDWEERIAEEEELAISVIRAYVNYEDLEKDTKLLQKVVTQYVKYQLLISLVHMPSLVEQGDIALEQFEKLITVIQENQTNEGLTSSEEYVPLAGVEVW